VTELGNEQRFFLEPCRTLDEPAKLARRDDC
jgi:hypothetical protein